MVACDDRTHVDIRARVGRADPHPPGQVAEPINQAISDGPHWQGHAPGHAALPGATEGRRLHRPGCLVEVGVGHDDQVVLGPARRLHPLALPGAGLIHVPRIGRRADERNRVHHGVFEQGVDALLVSMDDVQNSLREARLHE